MRPIDLNNLLPKTQQLSKVQQMENNKHKDFMHNQVIFQNKKFENELKKVNTTDKTYDAKIHNKQKNNKSNSKSKKDTKHEQNSKEKDKMVEDVSDGIVGSKIDIKI